MRVARLMHEMDPEPPAVSLSPGAVAVTLATGKTPLKTPLKTPPKTPPELPEATLQLLREQPELSFPQIALLLGKSDSAVKRAARKLRDSGRLTRIGPHKGGYWKVIE